ncbi:MAG: glutamate--cysteine ligase [Desulfuromonas sp.]|nr:MAG: glutamate--cysteine ligase [Desulfuromonas sp.]
MSTGTPLSLFAGFGIELEYMIVDCADLHVRPVSDKVLEQVAGVIVNEVEVGELCWSNELVLHVLELKTNGPATELARLGARFQEGIREVNARLASLNARLLGTAMHPWMDPHRETRLWPHENSPIYTAYNRIFSCQGHGWSNLQSMHINLPFADDAEFGRLHAAIRPVLPLLPALAASSPIVDLQTTGLLDNRLEYYRTNQRKIPEISGEVIPEAVFTRTDYERQILAATYKAIAPHDPEGVLQDEWLNSRGAIARFERNAIEIRLLDIQECPRADLAIAALVVALIRALCTERWVPLVELQRLPVAPLAALFRAALRDGGATLVTDAALLECFGLAAERISAAELWQELYLQLEEEIPEEYRSACRVILQRGALAQRILNALPRHFSKRELSSIYHELAECLDHGEQFRA